MSEGSRIESYESPDYVEFTAAGEAAAGVFHCADCGYGVTVQRRLPLCPMCGGAVWEPSLRLPFMQPANGPLH